VDHDGFVRLAAVAFGLILVGFLVRGTVRLAAPTRTAALASAPFLLAALVLVAALVARGLLDRLGLWPLDDG